MNDYLLRLNSQPADMRNAAAITGISRTSFLVTTDTTAALISNTTRTTILKVVSGGSCRCAHAERSATIDVNAAAAMNSIARQPAPSIIIAGST